MRYRQQPGPVQSSGQTSWAMLLSIRRPLLRPRPKPSPILCRPGRRLTAFRGPAVAEPQAKPDAAAAPILTAPRRRPGPNLAIATWVPPGACPGMLKAGAGTTKDSRRADNGWIFA